MALHDGDGAANDYPESEHFEERPSRLSLRDATLLGAGAALTGGALVWAARKVST